MREGRGGEREGEAERAVLEVGRGEVDQTAIQEY